MKIQCSVPGMKQINRKLYNVFFFKLAFQCISQLLHSYNTHERTKNRYKTRFLMPSLFHL